MIPHITWTQYLLASASLIIIYYLVIGARYYRQEIQHIFRNGIKLRSKSEQSPMQPNEPRE